MIRMLRFPLLLLFSGVLALQAQRGDFGDETALYAESKQVNQFFRRFNCEEGRDGERFYPGNPLYRDPEFRRQYLDIVFDNESGKIPKALKQRFTDQVCRSEKPVYLDFHGGRWFAEVQTRFTYEGAEKDLTLFLELEQDRLGTKWVVSRVFFDPYARRFPSSYAAEGDFLHPLSHELDFMNLNKVFRNSGNLQGYVSADFEPDQLTLFLMDFQSGKLVFRTITDVRFHFFQVDGWYFELRDVRRSGYNTGWLITRLQTLDPSGEAALLQEIYHAKP